MNGKEGEELSFKALRVSVPKERPEPAFQRSVYHWLSQLLGPTVHVEAMMTPKVTEALENVESIEKDVVLVAVDEFEKDLFANSKKLLKFLHEAADGDTAQFRKWAKVMAEANIAVKCLDHGMKEVNENSMFMLRLASVLLPFTPAHPQVLPPYISRLLKLYLETESYEDELVLMYTTVILMLKLYGSNVTDDISVSIEFCPPRSGSVEDPSNMAFLLIGSIPEAFKKLEDLAKKATNNRTKLFCRGSYDPQTHFKPGRSLLIALAEPLAPLIAKLSKRLAVLDDSYISLYSWSIMELLAANFEASCPLDAEILSMVVEKTDILDTIIPEIEKHQARISTPSIQDVTAISLPILPELTRVSLSLAIKFMQRQISYVPWRISKYLKPDSVINLAAIISQQKDDILCPALANFIGSVGTWAFDSSSKIPSHILGSVYMFQTEFDAFPLWPVDPVLSAISPNLDPNRRVVIDEQKLFGLACQHCLTEGIAPIPFNV